MPRRVQDIVPGDRRGIRNVPVEKDQKKSETKSRTAKKFDEKEPPRAIPIHKSVSKLEALDRAAEEKKKSHTSLMPPAPKRTRKRRKAPWIIIGVCVVVVVLAAAFIASTYFSLATFTIVPRSIPVNVNSTYIAQGTPASGALSYDLVPVQGTASSTVVAVDGPQVSIKAQGKVTLYNAYSNQAQRLIAGTRIANDSGLIYRLTGSVVIPGYTTKSGRVTPGTVTATVQADQPGASYNITGSSDVSDFKIVAYKGTPRYSTMYARIASDITGGFVGTKKTVSPALLASTTAQLKAQLTNYLQTKANAAVPNNDIMYPNAFSAVFSAPVVSDSGTNSATISVSGTLYGIAFNQAELVTKLASEQAVESFNPYGFTSPGLDELAFSISNASDFNPAKKTALIMKLKGSFTMVGIIPVTELKQKLAGVPLANTQAVLKPYYGSVIESGSGELVPAWAKVPTDTSRITVNMGKP